MREQSAAQRDFSTRKNEAGEVFVQLKQGQIIWDITMEEKMQLYFGKKKLICLILPYKVLLWQPNVSANTKSTITIEMIKCTVEGGGGGA